MGEDTDLQRGIKMEDAAIIELYWERNEDAIRETDVRYGRGLHTLAGRIVQTAEDAEESVSDTYMRAWNTIPPLRPCALFAYLAKICRSLALDRLDWSNAAKRKAEIIPLSEELQLCIPDDSHERRDDGKEIGRLLNAFLAGLPKDSRVIFVRRYWFADTIDEIAARYGMSQSKVKTQLHRTRAKLRVFLEKEGISV